MRKTILTALIAGAALATTGCDSIITGIGSMFKTNHHEYRLAHSQSAEVREARGFGIPEYRCAELEPSTIRGEHARPYHFEERNGDEWIPKGTYIVVGADAQARIDRIINKYEDWKCDAIEPFEIYSLITYLANSTNEVSMDSIQDVKANVPDLDEFIVDYIIDENLLHSE